VSQRPATAKSPEPAGVGVETDTRPTERMASPPPIPRAAAASARPAPRPTRPRDVVPHRIPDDAGAVAAELVEEGLPRPTEVVVGTVPTPVVEERPRHERKPPEPAERDRPERDRRPRSSRPPAAKGPQLLKDFVVFDLQPDVMSRPTGPRRGVDDDQEDDSIQTQVTADIRTADGEDTKAT